jgi:predicted Zn-dependent peptidase
VTLPGKETAALDLISREFQRLATSAPTDEEFEMARNAAIGHYATDLQPHPDRALEYARTAIAGGRPADVEAQPESMISIRKSDLKRVAESSLQKQSERAGNPAW